ncbi:MAG: CDP-alcohol phosphatidyltransferase family protein [Candidatus Promineifilaceae bacterium]
MTQTNSAPQNKTLTDHLRINGKFIVDPIVTVFAALGLSPNMITFAGFLVHIPIAWFLSQGEWRIATTLGLLSFFDALDGALARKLGKAHNTKFGGFLDSMTDRCSEILLYGGAIAYYVMANNLSLVLITLAALGGSLMVSYARSRAEALGFECKVGLFSRVERYLTLFVFGMLLRPDLAMIVLAIGTWFTVGQRAWTVWQQANVVLNVESEK